ncbi:MAG: phosphoglycerate kinase [Parachlamydiales bacterium]|jgi:phosphoglycerate kinase
MAQKLSISDLNLHNKKVLMRVDFNVPLDDSHQITDDTRISASLPSIRHILKNGGSVILMSHLGRPNGEVNPEFSLKPCAARLSILLDHPIMMAPDCIGPDVERLVSQLKPGQVLLLENLRFHKGEEKPEKDPSFAKSLASLGDLYINDAFGTAHRAHASTAAIAQYFPGKAAAGFLLQKEIEFIGHTLENPKRPFQAIIGGAKISTKLGVIRSLLKKVDTLLIGGGMSFTFFKAQGYAIGNSIHEDEMLNEAKSILESVKGQPNRLILPVDIVIANAIKEDAETRIIDPTKGIPEGFEGVDIGPETIRQFSSHLQKAGTVIWNGPLGVFEVPKFAAGTRAIANTVANIQATTIVGGGDSIAALQQMGLADSISHLSTGGGATLEYIEFGKLPGIESLSDKK